MGYNGSNRVGFPQRGSGFKKSSFRFGGAVIGGISGLIGALFGPWGVIFLFIAIFRFDAFLIIIGACIVAFIAGLILAANGVLKPEKQTDIKDDEMFSPIDVSNDTPYNVSHEHDLINILNDMPPYPKTYKKIARKCIREGSKVKRKSDGEILYVIEVLKDKFKCYDFTARECIWVGKDEIVTNKYDNNR